MKTFEVLEHAGPNKVVRLAIPVEEANRRYHLVVLFPMLFGPTAQKVIK
jgi:hypothetical protein